PAGEPQAPVVVHPFEMHRIDRVLLALEKVAGYVGEHDLAEPILPGERLPYGELGRRLRPHVDPEQAGELAHRIGFRGAALLRPLARTGRVFVRLLDALTGFVHQPAMVAAADAAGFDPAVGQVGAAMRTMTVDEPVAAGQVLVEDEVFAHQPHRLDRALVELARTGNG